MQNDTTHALQVINQSQWDQLNNSLMDDIPAFKGKHELYFDQILKLEYTCCDQMEPQRVSFSKGSRCSYDIPQIGTSWCELEQCKNYI